MSILPDGTIKHMAKRDEIVDLIVEEFKKVGIELSFGRIYSLKKAIQEILLRREVKGG